MTRHLQQPETRNLANLNTRTVLAGRFSQSVLDIALVLLWAHVNKVDNDQATQVTNSQLPCNFLGGFEVGIECRCLDIAALGCAGRIDVDRYQRFSVIDDDAAAGRQRDRMRERRFDLAFDLEARKKRYRIVVVFQLLQVVRHDLFDELQRFFICLFVVNQDFADVIGQIVTQCAHDRVALPINQEG